MQQDKIQLLELESLEKEEKENRGALQDGELENGEALNEKTDPKILEFQEILERLITQELHAKKRRGREMADAG